MAKLLLVDDIGNDLRAMKKIALSIGYAVTAFSFLDEAYREVKENDFDLVISDRNVPKQDDGIFFLIYFKSRGYEANQLALRAEGAKRRLKDFEGINVIIKEADFGDVRDYLINTKEAKGW